MRRLLLAAQRKFRNSRLHRSKLLNVIYVHVIRRYVRYKSRDPVIFRGFTVNIHPTDVTVSPGLITGNYERFELDLLKVLLAEGDQVMDVGANIGVFALEASKQVGDTGLVIAIEPEAQNVDLLKVNLKNNDVKNVRVVQAAVADFDGETFLHLDGRNSGTHRLSHLVGTFTESELGPEDRVRVETRSLNSLHKAHQISSLRLLKIDIEGFEPLALTEDLLEDNPPDALLIEFVPRHLVRAGFEPVQFLNLLLKNFEQCFIILESKRSLQPIQTWLDIEARSETNLLLIHRMGSFENIA